MTSGLKPQPAMHLATLQYSCFLFITFNSAWSSSEADLASSVSTPTFCLRNRALIFVPNRTDLVSQRPLQFDRPTGFQECSMVKRHRALFRPLSCLMAGGSAATVGYKTAPMLEGPQQGQCSSVRGGLGSREHLAANR